MSNNVKTSSSDLPVDIVFEVLSRLPVKTLIRLKSVCKTWYALIENPNFVKTYKKEHDKGLEPTYNNMIVTTNCPGNTKRLSFWHISEDLRTLVDTELSYLPCVLEDCVVLCAYNGLVCLGLSIDSTELIICNPTTRQFRQTPKCKLLKTEKDLIFLGLRLHVNDYEIIRIIYTCTGYWYTCTGYWYDYYDYIPVIRAEMYTMSSDTWREIDVKLGRSKLLGYLQTRVWDYLEAVLIDGVFYWTAEHNNGYAYVAYFDTRKNVFDVIGGPREGEVTYDSCWHLLEIKGKLGSIVYNDYYNDAYYHNMLELWVLNEDMYWTKIHEIGFHVIPRFLWKMDRVIRVVGSIRSGKLVLVDQFENNLKLLLYDLNSRETKCLFDADTKESIVSAFLYMESLTPVS